MRVGASGTRQPPPARSPCVNHIAPVLGAWYGGGVTIMKRFIFAALALVFAIGLQSQTARAQNNNSTNPFWTSLFGTPESGPGNSRRRARHCLRRCFLFDDGKARGRAPCIIWYRLWSDHIWLYGPLSHRRNDLAQSSADAPRGVCRDGKLRGADHRWLDRQCSATS